MYPPVYAIVKDDPVVQAALGSEPRVYPFGQAPQFPATPYAVWQVISGAPENYINDTPNIDSYGVQVDVYADSVATVRSVAVALRGALEKSAHVVSWRGEHYENDTKLYRVSFDVDFWTPR